MHVVLVQWPDDEGRRDEARRQGEPRLILLHGDGPPPMTSDPLEDWVRLPASPEDVRHRVATLAERAQRMAVAPTHEDGVVRYRGAATDLSPVEARLFEVLFAADGTVVSRSRLATAGWPDGQPDRNTLDVAMGRLRRRLARLGLTVHTVRSRGFRLEIPTAATP